MSRDYIIQIDLNRLVMWSNLDDQNAGNARYRLFAKLKVTSWWPLLLSLLGAFLVWRLSFGSDETWYLLDAGVISVFCYDPGSMLLATSLVRRFGGF